MPTMILPRRYAITWGLIILTSVKAQETVILQVDGSTQSKYPLTITAIPPPTTTWFPPENCKNPGFSTAASYNNTSIESSDASLNTWFTFGQYAYFTVGCAPDRTTCCPPGWNPYGYYASGWQPGGYPYTASRPIMEDENPWTKMTTASGQLLCPSFSSSVYERTISLEASSMLLFYSSIGVFESIRTITQGLYQWNCVWHEVTESTLSNTVFKFHNYLMANAMIVVTSSTTSTGGTQSPEARETDPVKPSMEDEKGSLSKGVIAGIAVGVGVPVLLIVAFVIYKIWKRPRKTSEPASENGKMNPGPTSILGMYKYGN